MKRILLFEPWHLGDVAVALSVVKPFQQPGVEFSLAGDKKWKDWALDTGVIENFFSFTPPWTAREVRNKYNPFHYRLSAFTQFRKEVLTYEPDAIIELRNDIRAKSVLKLLFSPKIPIVCSNLQTSESVYKRGETIKQILSVPKLQTDHFLAKENRHKISLFLGAADNNRALPQKVAIQLLIKLSEDGYFLNWILQPCDEIIEIEKLLKDHGLHNVTLLQGDLLSIISQIKSSSLVISTDSGWLHIAHFYELPTIGLFAFDTIKTWLPPGGFYVIPKTLYPAHYRYKNQYRHLQPLLELSVDDVVGLVKQINGQALTEMRD